VKAVAPCGGGWRHRFVIYGFPPIQIARQKTLADTSGAREKTHSPGLEY
jgi:hypothetical protein